MAEQRVRSLLRHLSGSNAAAQRQAASTLAVVVIDEQHEQALAAAGGVPLVLQLAWGSSSPDVQANMAILLANLCGQACSGQGEGISSSLLAAVEAAGGVRAVVRHLSSSHSLPAQLASAALLAFLCRLSPERCEQVAAAGAIPALLRLLGSCHAGGIPSPPQEALLAAAAAALSMLATNSERAESIAAGGGVQLLCRCLTSCSQDGKAEEEAASALASMALVLPNPAALSCTMPALVPLLAHRSARTQLAAAVVLQSVTCTNNTAVADSAAADIVAAGGVSALVHLLCSSSAGESSLKCAAAALCSLLFDNASAKLAAIEAGAAPALVRLLGHDSTAVQVAAAASLGNLCCNQEPRVKAALRAAGVPAALVCLLQRSPDPGVQSAAAGGLRNLAARDPSSFQAAEAAGVTPALVAALGSPHADVQEAAVDALGNLASVDALLPAITAAGASAALERLCDSSSADVREAAAEVLGIVRREAVQPLPVDAARPPAPRVCAAPGCGATRGLRRCGGCGSVRYCSEACSKAHWRTHKAECRRLQAERAAAAAHAASS